jgi:glycosyltransferase involved in cell wall biosynthesis
MIIGYDAKRAFRNNSGLGNYSRMVIGGVCREGHGMVKSLLFTPTTKGRHTHYFDDIQEVEVRQPKGLWTMAGGLWRSVWSGLCARREGVDIYHGLSHELPLFLGNGVKKVVTMHDLIVRRYPKFFKPADRIIHRLKMRHACRVADMVIAISEQTKRDLVDLMHVPEEKIRVVYQSCDPIFWNPPSAILPPSHSAVQLPERYIIAVGTVEERKNQVAVVKALAQLPADVHLVIVGKNHGGYHAVLSGAIRSNGLTERVHILHDADFEDFPALYAGAVASVYMSLFEGFGIPILESMCCGTPVVTSNVSSMPEAGGDAALYADPKNPDEIAARLKSIIDDPVLRSQLVEKGKVQCQKFTPHKAVSGLYDLYMSLLPDEDPEQ